MQKDILSKAANVQNKGKVVPFRSKMEQAADLIKQIQGYYQKPVLAVTDSWFGNNGLWEPLAQGAGGKYHLLARMRTNNSLYDCAIAVRGKRGRGRPRKYGNHLGNVDDCATKLRDQASNYTVFLYGKNREVQAYSQLVMSQRLKCPIRVVWVYKKTRYVALMSTDMELSVEQIIEYYGAR